MTKQFSFDFFDEAPRMGRRNFGRTWIRTTDFLSLNPLYAANNLLRLFFLHKILDPDPSCCSVRHWL